MENRTTKRPRAPRATATKKTYASQLRAFQKWLQGDVLSATPTDVVDYLVGPGVRKSHSWRVQASAAIRSTFDASGLHSPTKHTSVRHTLRSMRGHNPTSSRRIPTLTEEAITAIEAAACHPRIGRGGHTESAEHAHYRGLTDIAMVRIMHDTSLRRSRAADLTWGDITIEPDGSGKLRMPSSMRASGVAGEIAILSHATVEALTAIWSPYNVPEMSLFGLCARQISLRIQAAAKAAGLEDDVFGHSDRTEGTSTTSGAATNETPEDNRL